MANILIVHAVDRYPMRATVQEHLYSFRKYSPHNCFYLNLRARQIPRYLNSVKFDLIIFHTTFLSSRWAPELFKRLVEKASPLKQSAALKVMLPQDEFIYTDVLCDFISEFQIDCVFTVAPESEWQNIYRSVNFDRVKFFNVLTGYLDEATVTKLRRLEKSAAARTVDIGYRAWRAAPWLGRHGLLKVKVAELFQQQASDFGLLTDISTNEADTLLADDWYKFLFQCKYTIGVEGGASVLDRDGTIKQKTEAYLALHPQAGFEEVEQACFPGLDGSFELRALSPRNLEACATRTCQVLIEGDYNGVLIPGEHYIPLERDLSNIRQVLDSLKADTERIRIRDNAYRDIVECGRYTYRSFVQFVVEQSLQSSVRAQQPQSARSFEVHLIRCRMRVADSFVLAGMWFTNVRGRWRLRTRMRQALFSMLPNSVSSLILRPGRAGNP